MSEAMIFSTKKKNKFFKKKLRKPCPKNKMKFKKYNTVYTRLVRIARKNIMNTSLKNMEEIVKKTWQTINSDLGW